MKIISKEYVPNEDVYNMEVEDTHCFAATKSNIIIHNCLDALRYAVVKMEKKKELDVTRNLGL